MADKILKFKKDEKSKYERANRHCDDGDYVGALSSLLYMSASEPKNTEVLCHIADIYTELGLYENAIIFWFRYLSVCKKSDAIDGYNGLGANFFFLDNTELAGFYFNKQLELGDMGVCVYDDVLDDYVDSVSGFDRQPEFKVISSESDAAAKDEANYFDAVEKNKTEDYIAAIKSAEEVLEKSDYYGKALYEKAYALFCLDRDFEAEETLEKSISINGKDVNSYNLLFNCLAQTGDSEKTEKYFDIFLNTDSDDAEFLNKKMAILCDFGYFREALDVSEKIMRIAPEDTNCAYLRGMLYYNLKEKERAVACLKKAYLYSMNPVALYYLRIAERAVEGDKSAPKRLPLIFEIQKAEADRRLDIVKKLFTGAIKKNDFSDEYISEVFDWCYYCGNQTAQIAIALYAVKNKKTALIEKLRMQLVNPAITDDIKIRIYTLFVESGVIRDKEETPIVYSNIFKKIKISIPSFGVDVSTSFRQGYAIAAGRISVYFDKDFRRLSVGASELEAAMRLSGGFKGFMDSSAIACAMFIYSGINHNADMVALYRFFDTTKEDVAKLMAYASGKKND